MVGRETKTEPNLSFFSGVLEVFFCEKKSKKKFEDRYGKLKPDLPDPVQE